MTSKSEHYIDTKEIVATEIIAKIPAGYRYDYMERVESPDGGTAVRIHIKKENQMTSELKCPFCGQGLKDQWVGQYVAHEYFDCPKCKMNGNTKLWQALIQVKQDLEIATKALEEIRDETGEDRAGFSYVVLATNMKETAENALEQIDHFADVSKMIEHKEI